MADNKIIDEEASFGQAVHNFIFSDALMNCVVIVFITCILGFFVCGCVRELRIYIGRAILISSIIAFIFVGLLAYRSRFWKFFKK